VSHDESVEEEIGRRTRSKERFSKTKPNRDLASQDEANRVSTRKDEANRRPHNQRKTNPREFSRGCRADQAHPPEIHIQRIDRVINRVSFGQSDAQGRIDGSRGSFDDSFDKRC